VRFQFIAVERAHHSLCLLCRCMRVTRSGFYAWVKRAPSARATRDAELRGLVQASFNASDGRYGSPRILRDIKAKAGRVSRKRVIRLMQAEGLRARVRRRYRCTTQSDPSLPVAPNLLARNFTAAAPDTRWVGDTTEFPLGEGGKLYLAVILDLFSRFVVGWAVSRVNDRHLTLSALEMALARRRPGPGLWHHSDRGCTYASEDYRARLVAAEMLCSMSRRGDCYDNAVMESLFSTIKMELADSFTRFDEGQHRLFEYLEVFYNQRRRHSTLDYVSPAEFERLASRPTPPSITGGVEQYLAGGDTAA
jgi:putative transposase